MELTHPTEMKGEYFREFISSTISKEKNR